MGLKPDKRATLSLLVPRVCGAAVMLIGMASIVAWELGKPFQQGGWFLKKAPMSPTAALLFIMLGLGLAGAARTRPSIQRLIAMGTGGAIALFGASCLVDLANGSNLHFGHWFMNDQMTRNRSLGRVGMVPTTVISFILIGGGMALLESGNQLRAAAGQWSVVAALMIATAALIGHVYEGLGLYQIGQILPMALSTSVNFILAAIGIFALRPKVGFVAVLTAPNMGGTTARRLFAVAVILPPLLGFLSLTLMQHFPIENAGGIGLLATLCGLVLAVAVTMSASRLERMAEALIERGHQLEIARLEADQANRAKSEFLATMSHELRTPLNAVIGFSEIMRDARFGPIDSRYREYSDDIHKSGLHLLGMVNQILDLAKVEAGQFTLQEERISLPELAADCLSLVRQRAAFGEVSVENRVPADFPPLRGDEMRLRQIVLNLLSNAVKFTRPGGTVTLDANLGEAGDIEIVIADTGIGMDEKQLAMALLPFRQIDSSIARRDEGTGLGLPLARTLIEQHGGTLILDSTPGVGTTARICLRSDRQDIRAPQDAHGIG